MCPPKVPDPEPIPDALEGPSKTATGIKSKGSSTSTAASTTATESRGLDSLRVDLAVPDAPATGSFGSLLANIV